jgi:hypothetical protein
MLAFIDLVDYCIIAQDGKILLIIELYRTTELRNAFARVVCSQ